MKYLLEKVSFTFLPNKIINGNPQLYLYIFDFKIIVQLWLTSTLYTESQHRNHPWVLQSVMRKSWTVLGSTGHTKINKTFYLPSRCLWSQESLDMCTKNYWASKTSRMRKMERREWNVMKTRGNDRFLEIPQIQKGQT